MHPPTPQPSLEVVAAAKSSSGRANAHKAAAAAAGKAVQSEGGGQSPSPAATDAPQLLYAAAAAPGHTLPDHVEQPARVDVILQKLKAAGITTSAFEGQLRQVPAAQLAPLEDVRRVHSYVDELRRVAAEEAPKAVADIGDPDGVTYVTQTSFDDALRAAGAATALVDAVVSASRGGGPGTAAFCITRPPGHHATADTPLGYCLFNNVALAARHAQRRHGLAKVGGQGGAAGLRHAGEACVLAVFDSLIAPAARRFRPDIILVSAGFDAHWRDPFQQLQFRSSTYHKLAVRLRQLAAALCGGRLVFLLEGGYHTEAVGESVCEVFLALLGRRSVEGQAALELPHEEPVGEVGELVAQLRGIHGL
ncbi:hypothetical protein CHLNCDRAFT_139540 [Chlorella variabilis]|uniref:Histone deacetylase domain-containing protein n=1 Tax=Chlorella variabilis TaxID=554065 RepID=E1ZQD3_CHLVA|nr:hypothetical protein CHLNCDRAFT_139540 [Chlorella variabilis]EFN52004.1 hypothetical protein CHLNCDRAFT_139540 [Chlorella variabilis]|eukprot:XP_005844106.1 hypothetical protein CHLNCDRAFT_139540 [Chlorella variabilis]